MRKRGRRQKREKLIKKGTAKEIIIPCIDFWIDRFSMKEIESLFKLVTATCKQQNSSLVYTGCQACRSSRSDWDADGNREWTGDTEGDVGNSVQLLQEQNFFVWPLWQQKSACNDSLTEQQSECVLLASLL